MVKRENNLFEKITDSNNMRLAYLKALKGKRNSNSAILFSLRADENLRQLREKMVLGIYRMKKYNNFKIYDPKERLISAAHFEDRVVHHSIVNILEPVFERQFIFHTYACRKEKGIHKAVQYAFRKAKTSSFYLKLDIRKFFDSIDHNILKKQLERIIKDKRCLELLAVIIDSYSLEKQKGLPIGNLTSQFFANLYLSGLDHFILEKLKPLGFVRYMDDMIVFSGSKENARMLLSYIKTFCFTKLNLNLKESVLSECKNGIPFLGYKITPLKIILLKKSRIRMNSKLRQIDFDYKNNLCSESKAYERAISVTEKLSS